MKLVNNTLLGFFTATFLQVLTSLPAYAALEDVCTDLNPLKGIKYKAIPSDHITTGPRVGGISLIYKKGVKIPTLRCLSLYDSNGVLLAKFGKYSPNGNIFGARYYSGTGCANRTTARKIATTAFAQTGNRQGYIATGSGSCLTVTNLLRDEGSVR